MFSKAASLEIANMKEKDITLIRLWLLVLNLAVIFGYGVILVFTDLSILKYQGLKVAVAIGVANAIAHFVLNSYFDKKPEKALEIEAFASTLYAFLFVDYSGGPTGLLFPFIYVAILIGFFVNKKWGYTVYAFTMFYIAVFAAINGQEVFTALSAQIIPMVSTTLTAVAGFVLGSMVDDIRRRNSQLDQVADKLTAEKSQDEAVLTAIADGVYAVDMDRNLVLLNKAAQEMTNWTEKEALGLPCKTVMKLKKDDDTSVCEKDCPALAVWNTGQPVFRNDTCFVNRKSHRRVQLSTSYAPIHDYEGKMAGAICVFRDVTKEREVERLRNEFVSTASHELRTPITATEGYLSIVTDSGMCKYDDKTKEFVEKARGTLLNMSKLIKNLLAVTKIEEGKLETNITSFSIHDLVKEVIDVFEKQAKEKNIDLNFAESKDLSLKGKKVVGRSLNVRADREMIREVLNNLIENAIKFTAKGGVTVSIDYDQEFATINVEDTGMGMPADAQKHLFEKFYRVDNTATREVGGTGLGLYITRSIVETFGGRIWVESASGKGSKFHFTVPLSLD